MPPYSASDIQDARFISAGETTAEESLLFRGHLKEITARMIHAGTAENPHVECHIAVKVPQLVKHCFSKGLHFVEEPARKRKNES
ncbi:MAG: hypothetical protein QOH88_3169 [Verrucomicrobiota bacterium]|jgi:hypothetical protein